MSTFGSSLEAQKLRQQFDPENFDFDTTDELGKLDQVIGQGRAVDAVTFGIDIQSPGYNIFALGTRGTGKANTIQDFLDRRAQAQDVPSDLVYVNNFERPDRPQAIELPPGEGLAFKKEMDQLVEQLETEVPQSFESEDYKHEREQIEEEFANQRKQLLEDLEDKAQEKDFTVLQTSQGLMLAPVVQGEPLTPEKFNQLDEDVREDIEQRRETLQDDLKETMQQIEELQGETREQVEELDRQIVGFAVEGLVDQLREQYEDCDQITDFLDEVLDDIMDNIDTFKMLQDDEEQQIPPWIKARQQEEVDFNQYRVNLIVDHTETDGAPVVLESNPTYYNLVGRIEHKGEYGNLTTDFTMIKQGSLHQANGGYLMIEARDLLTKPFAWEALKRALKNQEIRTETMGQEYRAVQTQSLEPEIIPLDVKVVLLGDPYIYYLLHELDEDFQELFKVKADFNVETDRDDDIIQKYAQFVGNLCDDEDLTHFAPDGVGRIVREASRMVDDQTKISAQFGKIADLVRESSYWADENGHDHVRADDVHTAVHEKIYRSNKLEEKTREYIADDTILIDTDGAVTGQVNGISVLPLGDYRFGKPTRITAQVRVGNEGIINVEREVELGGNIHNKGMMILTGYLGSEFAREEPLALTASITFEQSYSEVDGDSASSTELYALLSRLSDCPIKQNLAVTGSINQHGDVQAIGGVNEKIEGFFRVCEQDGLTGDQGVLIPESNTQHLMLRDEIVEAVEQDQFHIFPVEHVDRGIEILTGEPAGERQDDGSYPGDTVKGQVQQKLSGLAQKSRDFASDREDDAE